VAKERDGGRIEVEDGLLAAGFVQLPVALARDPNISAGAKLVYVALLWYYWRAQDYPGQRPMAEDFGFSERSARNYLHELEREGYLECRRPGLQQVNTYLLRSILTGRICRSGAATTAGQERQNLPLPLERLDSDFTRTESESVPAAKPPKPLPSDPGSDSDFAQAIRETATALRCTKEAKQLTTLAQAERWPADLIRTAGRVVGEAIANGADVRKPGAYLTTAVRVMLSDRRQAGETGKKKATDRRQDALAYARQIFADPIIGGSWRQVEAILRESYGQQVAAWVAEQLGKGE